MRSNLEDVHAAHLSASGKSAGDEVQLVNRPCRFRGLYSSVKSRAVGGDTIKMELLDGSGGTVLIAFNVARTPSAYGIVSPMVSMMIPDGTYVQFDSSLYIKAPSDANGLNTISYTLFYT
tara:strand:- start:240 stop:599 length:360 start_codon:yes stop_codon:yes gene_type:complete